MLSSKIRTTIIALSAVGAVLASSTVASAATVVRRPGSVATPVLSAPPKAMALDPGKVGGAGQPGFDTARCEQIARNLNDATNKLQSDSAKGNLSGAQMDALLAENWASQIGDHCLVPTEYRRAKPI